MRAERLQQRAADQEALVENVGCQLAAIVHALRFGQADLDHLPGVIPFIDRRRDIEAFVALQANQRSLQRRGQHLGNLGLAHARLALAEQRTAQLEGEIEDGGEAAIGDVVAALQKFDSGIDGGRRGGGHATPRKTQKERASDSVADGVVRRYGENRKSDQALGRRAWKQNCSRAERRS